MLQKTISLLICLNWVIFVFSGLADAQGNYNVEFVGIEPAGEVRNLFVEGNYVYLCISAAIVILDVSDPVHPQKLGGVAMPDDAIDIYIQQRNYAYVADSGKGLRIIDINNPEEPKEVGAYEMIGVAYGVAISDEFAYIAYGN
jgi:hypothetical protein